MAKVTLKQHKQPTNQHIILAGKVKRYPVLIKCLIASVLLNVVFIGVLFV